MTVPNFVGLRTTTSSRSGVRRTVITGVGDFTLYGDLNVQGSISGVISGSTTVETAETTTSTENLATLAVNSSGTPGAGFGGNLAIKAETTTTPNTLLALIKAKWATATHASRAGSLSLIPYYQATPNTALEVAASSSGAKIGFLGATPVVRASAYTQTFATAARTLSAYTTDAESGAYTGLADGVGGTPYAALADLNSLRVAYENLRAHADEIGQVLNSVIDDLQAVGLVA